MCVYTNARWADMCLALKSLREQTLPPREIIVVVDHNTALLQRVRSTLPDVVAIANTEARGLSGARNSGIAAARGALVAFMDEDAVADLDWLAHLSAGYTHPQVLGVGGAIVPTWDGGRPAWFPSEFDWVVGCTYTGMPEQTAPVRNLIGCNMSFRREVFAAVGGFREGIGRVGKRPVGCEETELCIRVRQRWPQGVLRYEPRAQVRHRVRAERARWSYLSARCYAEGWSKALVARYVGAQDALSSERRYVVQTLPRGVLRAISRSLQGNRAELGQVGAIVGGLALTAADYLAGRLEQRTHGRRPDRRYKVPLSSSNGGQ
jgi:GT2 family glycosyltransferase